MVTMCFSETCLRILLRTACHGERPLLPSSCSEWHHLPRDRADISFVDPTLELDVYADKPWALSPILSTMNYLSLKKGATERKEAAGEFVAEAFKPIEEDALGLVGMPDDTTDISYRRRYFGNPGNREGVTLDKDVEVGMEFSNGILGELRAGAPLIADFNTLSVQLPRPFTLSFPLLKYWDGQPVTYVCRKRTAPGESPVSADGVYWSVAFEIIDEEATAELEKKGKKARRLSVSSEAGSASDVE